MSIYYTRKVCEGFEELTNVNTAGCLNLFSTGWLTRRFGVRFSLFFQTFWPSVRVLFQLWGGTVAIEVQFRLQIVSGTDLFFSCAVVNGGMIGIRVMQLTQLITILGGGAGYILCVNTYAAALVEPEERTATFGRLQGIQMLGSAAALSRMFSLRHYPAKFG